MRSGENLAATFMNDFPQPGALPIIIDGQVLGAMGVSIPLLAIAAIFTGLAGVIAVCAALAVIAIASARVR